MRQAGRNYLKFRDYDLDSYHFGFSDKPSAQDSIALAKEMVDYFTKEEVDEVYIIYTKFITALRQQVKVQKLLPVESPKAEAGEADKEPSVDDEYIFLPDAGTVLSKLLPEYVQVQVYNAMLQSAASELGSRMAAMSLQPTTRPKESPTSTLRTTKHVRHRSPTKFPKSSAAQLRLNKPA